MDIIIGLRDCYNCDARVEAWIDITYLCINCLFINVSPEWGLNLILFGLILFINFLFIIVSFEWASLDIIGLIHSLNYLIYLTDA